MGIPSFAVLALAGLATALPVTPCTSNWWEKLHEGHLHDINTGVWLGLPIHLVFPGGTGCYKGQRTVETTGTKDEAEEPDFSNMPDVSWMPGFEEAKKTWKKKPAPVSAPNSHGYTPAPAQAYNPAPYQPSTPTPQQPQPQPQVGGSYSIPDGMHLQLEPNNLDSAKNWDKPEIQNFRPGVGAIPNGWHLELVGVVNGPGLNNQPQAPPSPPATAQKSQLNSAGWKITSIPALSTKPVWN